MVLVACKTRYAFLNFTDLYDKKYPNCVYLPITNINHFVTTEPNTLMIILDHDRPDISIIKMAMHRRLLIVIYDRNLKGLI